MEQIYERCCALDVGQASVVACVRVPDREGKRSELRGCFSTVTSELLALRDWLQGLGVTHVAMEATGVYWKPVWYVLEDEFELILCHAAHVKNVPGRKTDASDAQWLCQLLDRQLKGEHGLDHYEGRSYRGFHHQRSSPARPPSSRSNGRRSRTTRRPTRRTGATTQY